MKTAKFVIEGPPVGKARHRSRRTNTGIRSYTPSKTVQYEKLVAMSFVKQCSNALPTGKMFEAPVELCVAAFIPIPASWSAKKRKAHNMQIALVKPDIDNVLKIVMDGLKGVAYKDDKQVWTSRQHKFYTIEKPFVRVGLAWDDNYL